MNLPLINLAVLLCTAITLCVALTLCWIYFGRLRYAQLWAIAAAGGVVQWIFTAFVRATIPDAHWPLVFTGILIVVDSSLIAIGSLHRTRRDPKLAWMIGAAGVTIAAMTYGLLVERNLAIRGFVGNLYVAVMMVIAAFAITPRNRRVAAPEIAVMTAFLLFGALELALAVLSLSIGADAAGPGFQSYRDVLTIGLPAGYAAIGVAAVFLLAIDLNEKLRSLGTRDATTGSLNPRGLEQATSTAFADARRNGRDLAVVLGSIDRFRTTTARMGAEGAVRALVAFSDHLAASVREEDIFARTGLSEFCLILIDATPEAAARIMERARRELETMSVPADPPLVMTASFGITRFNAGDVSLSDVLARADRALERSKDAGGNRVTIEDGARA